MRKNVSNSKLEKNNEFHNKKSRVINKLRGKEDIREKALESAILLNKLLDDYFSKIY